MPTRVGELCPSCRTMSPDVRDMLLEWKKMGSSFNQREVQDKVLPRTDYWLDVCTLDMVFPALVNSGKLVQTSAGRYRLP